MGEVITTEQLFGKPKETVTTEQLFGTSSAPTEPQFVQGKPSSTLDSIWDAMKSIAGVNVEQEKAKAANALTYSAMLGISPSTAYQYHDEISEQVREKLSNEKIYTHKKGYMTSLQSGWQSSIFGMMANEKVPKGFESVDQLERWMHGMTTMALDLPVFLGGFVIGGGTPISGMAGGMGLTAGVRQVLVDKYSKGEAKDAGEFFDRTISAVRETVKGQIIGGFTGAAGVYAPTLWTKLGGMAGKSPVGWQAMNELSAMTAAGSLIEGRVPTIQDFVDNAAILLTMKAGTKGLQMTRPYVNQVKTTFLEAYTKYGIPPRAINDKIASYQADEVRQGEPLDTVKRAIDELKTENPSIYVEDTTTAKQPEKSATGAKVQPKSQQYGDLINAAAEQHGVDPSLVNAVIKAESNFNPNAQSPKGAKGLMQLMDATAADLGVTDSFNPSQNISGGVRYLAELLKRYNGDVEKAVAAYNWGMKRVDRFGDKPLDRSKLPEETRNYLDKVLGEKGTSLAKSVVNAEREARGEESLGQLTKRKTNWRDEVKRQVDSGEMDPADLVRRINNMVEVGERPPALTDEQIYSLEYHKKKIQNQLDYAREEIEARTGEGKDTTEDANRIIELRVQLNEIDKAGLAAGSEAGRALREFGAVMGEDYSYSGMIRAVQRDKTRVSAKIDGDVYRLSKEVSRLEKELEAERESKSIADADVAVKKIINMEKLAQRKQKRTLKIEELDTEFEQLAKDLNKELSGISANPFTNPEAIAKLVDMARNRVQKGIVKTADIVDSIYVALKNAGLEYSKKDISDAIAGYDFKAEMGIEQRIKKATTAVKQSIAEYERRIKEQDFGKWKRGDPVDSPELKELREKRDELKSIYEQMKEDAKPPVDLDEKDLAAWRKRKENQIKKLEQRIEEGDFAKREPKELPTFTDAELNIQFRLDAIKREFERKRLEWNLSQRGMGEKVWDHTVEAANLVKAVKASFDLSAAGRQGAFFFLAHPIQGFKNMPDMFRALGSEEAAFRIDMELKQRQNYQLYKKGELSLTERGGTAKEVEEIYRSRWAQAIPGVSASERAYVAFLNLARADLFDTMLKKLPQDRKATPEELKAIGNYANMATGRGTIKGYENALAGMGTFLWAPKLVLSRFQMLLGAGMWKAPNTVRAAVLGEYGRILASLSVVYLVSSFLGADIETDSRSSDFGKIKIGNTRLDPLAGVSQCSVLLSRLWTQETKKLSGRVVPLSGDYVPYGGTTVAGVMGNFMRSKLTPVLGLGINLMEGKDVTGKKITLYDIPKETMVPLSMIDIYTAIQEEGVPAGVALGTLGVFGVGLQIHDRR